MIVSPHDDHFRRAFRGGRSPARYPGIADCVNLRISEYLGHRHDIAPMEVTMAGNQTVAQRNLTCAIRIRERRRQLGLTQAEVVDRVNEHGSRLSIQALSAIENGRRLAVGRLPDLTAALRCSISYLLGLTADPHRWEPDDAGPPAPVRPAAAAVPVRRAQPGTHAAAGRGASPRRGWILGPDVPDTVPPRPRSS
jgi:transcriptional regulator with XRE-family HTH domain